MVEKLKDEIANVGVALATLGRLYALRNLGGRDVVERQSAARDFAICTDLANQMEDFATRYYHSRRTLISWPFALQPTIGNLIVNGDVALSTLSTVITQVSVATKSVIQRLSTSAEKLSSLAEPLFVLLKRIESFVPPSPAANESYDLDFSGQHYDRPVKVFRGPIKIHLGPHFKPTYSLTDRMPPEFGESIKENVPYFWVMATRETLASQMCALSAVEYDGLPLAFYSDMAKQCWDEARHSLAFVRLANTLMASERPTDIVDVLEPKNGGFPVPREGNLYESMLNATLVQRLVLMNQRSEAPAIPSIAKRLSSDFCRQNKAVEEFYEFDKIDETSHAAIGTRWLRHLVPDESERNLIAEEADLLRGVLLLTSFAHHGGRSITELAERFLQ